MQEPADDDLAGCDLSTFINSPHPVQIHTPLSTYLPGAAVVLVDDGLATGLTMQAAVAYARRHGAREVTVAVPCSAAEAATRFRREADRFVCLIVDPDFYAVGAYYEDFSPVTDDKVVAMLAGRTKKI